ncbi:MAG TPA: DMT family transporter [Thermoplasmata archaeon]|nr:DMT family transporter [Thermoplasmata archaeon]
MGERRGYASILTASALFGASATVGTYLLKNLGLNPLVGLVLAHGIASLAFLPFARRTLPRRADALLFAVWGLNGAALAPLLWFYGISLTVATEAALLANLEALFTITFAYVFLKERVPRRGYLGIALLLAGAVAVTTNLDFVSFGFTAHLAGNSLLIASSCLFGIDNNVSRVLISRYDRRGIPFFKIWIGLAVIIPISLAVRAPYTFSPSILALAVFLGIGSVAGVMWFFYIAFQEIGAMRTGALISTSALFGVAIAFGVFGTAPTAVQFGGGLLMVAGTFLTSEWTPRLRKNQG